MESPISSSVDVVQPVINKPSRPWYHAKLISVGITPTGYIAIGVVPMGIISIGIVPMGVVSIGTVAMGAIAAGFVSMGLATFGGVSMSLLNGHQTLNSPQNPAVIQDSQPTEPPNHHHNH
jgi:hypothetical protein